MDTEAGNSLEEWLAGLIMPTHQGGQAGQRAHAHGRLEVLCQSRQELAPRVVADDLCLGSSWRGK